jgi:hypothetical protein
MFALIKNLQDLDHETDTSFCKTEDHSVLKETSILK